jgi:hypothetical protein
VLLGPKSNQIRRQVSSQHDIRRTLEQVGINASSLDRIRLARGVVGKASYVAGAALLALGAVALVLREPLYLLILAICVLLIFVVYFGGVLWFAHRHPGVALLEGAELIQWRQMDMAAKSIPEGTRVAASEQLVLGSNQSSGR